MRASLLAIGLVAIVVSGCVPLRVSSARQQQINDCLERCPSVGGERQSPLLRENSWVDNRSTCEKRCHDIASGDWPKERPPEGSADAGPALIPPAP